MKSSLVIVIFLFLALNSVFAVDVYQDVIYLKNGTVIYGMIIEQVPGSSYTIKNGYGDILVYNASEIEKISKELKTEKIESTETGSNAGSTSSHPQKNLLGIQAGIAFTQGDFADGKGQNSTFAEMGFGNSFKLAGYYLKSLADALFLDVQIAYHFSHPYNDDPDAPSYMHINSTIIPLNLGVSYRLSPEDFGLHFDTGTGLYVRNIHEDYDYSGAEGKYNLTMFNPGFYLGLGSAFAPKNAAIQFNFAARWNVIFNSGKYKYSYDISMPFYGHQKGTEDVEKSFNDTYLDVMFGIEFHI